MVTIKDDASIEEKNLGILKRAIESEDSWTRAINGMLLNNIVRSIHCRMINDPVFSTIYNAGKNTALEIVASVYANRRNIPGLLVTEDEFVELFPEAFPAINYWNQVIAESNVDEITKSACYIGDNSSTIKGVELMLFDELYAGIINKLINDGYIVKKDKPSAAQSKKKDDEVVDNVDDKPTQLPIVKTPSEVVDGEFREVEVKQGSLDGTKKPVYEERVPEIKSNNDVWVSKLPKLDKIIYFAHKAGKSIVFSELNTTNTTLKNDLILATVYPAGDILKPERYLMIDYDKIYHNDINVIQNTPGIEDIYDEVVIPLCDQKAVIRMIEGKTTDDDISHQKVNEDWVKSIFKQVDFGPAIQGITFKDWNDLLRSLNKCAKYLKKEFRYKISQYTNPTKFILLADSTVKQYYGNSQYKINTAKDMPFIIYDPSSYTDGKSFEVGVYQAPDDSQNIVPMPVENS